MRTLSPELLAAQTAPSRHPLVEIKLGQFADEIPFVGNDLGEARYGPAGASVVMHSGGRVMAAYTDVANGASRNIVIASTDENRIEWDVQTVIAGTGSDAEIRDVSLAEDADGNLLLAWVRKDVVGKYRIEAAQIPVPTFRMPWGAVTRRTILAAQAEPISSPSLLQFGEGFVCAFCRDSLVEVESGGSYTGTTDEAFTVTITKSGAVGASEFKWRKGIGPDTEGVHTGTDVLLQDGVTVSFSTAEYWEGQAFRFSVVAARKATARTTITAQPIDGDTVTIGATVYTFRSALSEERDDPLHPGQKLPSVPYEARIDSLSTEITAENLRCAIEADTYEGTGAGVRYGTGTAAHSDVSATDRSGAIVYLQAKTAGTGGNAIATANSAARITVNDFAGGANAVIGDAAGVPSGKLYLTRAETIPGPWDAPVEPSIGGIGASRRKLDTCIYARGSDLWLFFAYLSDGSDDSTAVYNIVYSISHDNGETWGNAVSLTGYLTPDTTGRRPGIVSRTADTVLATYDEIRTALFKNKNDSNWNADISYVRHVQIDEASRKAFFVVAWPSAGVRKARAVLRVDLETWEIDRIYSATSVPALPIELTPSGGTSQVDWFAGDGRIVAVSMDGLTAVIDDEANTVRTLVWKNGIQDRNRNVDEMPVPASGYSLGFKGISVDAAGRNVYLVFDEMHGPTLKSFHVGSIPVDGTGNVQWTNVMSYSGLSWNVTWGYLQVLFDFPGSRLFLNRPGSKGYPGEPCGTLYVFSLSGSGLLKEFRQETHPNFPYYGLSALCIDGDYVYGTQKSYAAGYGQSSLYGFVQIDTLYDGISWIKPPYFEGEAPECDAILFAENRLMAHAYNHGIVVYDIATGQWSILNSDTVPGFNRPPNEYYAGPLVYDAVTESILWGMDDIFTPGGLWFVPVSGRMSRMQYVVGAVVDGVPSYEAAHPLVRGWSDGDGGAVYEPSAGSVWAVWTRGDTAGNKIKWDSEGGNVDVSRYLVRGEEIGVKRSVDGRPGSVRFMLSHGHLFDRTNANSTLSRLVRRGRKISLRWGERVDGIEYWMDDVFEFACIGTAMKLKRGLYPSISVEGEDRRAWADKQEIVATAYFSGADPGAAIEAVLRNSGGYEAGDILRPEFGTVPLIYHQFLNKTVLSVCNEICDRYGWFMDIDGSGRFTARYADFDAEPANVYDSGQIVEWSPDDRRGTDYNKVTVIGEGRAEIDILLSEESIVSDAGTLGFFCSNVTKRHYYSEDRTRRCRNPRLDVTQSVSSIGFRMGGKMRLAISDTDDDDTWVEVTASGPNLIPLFIAGLAMIKSARSVPPTKVSKVTVTTPAGEGVGTGTLILGAEQKSSSNLRDAGLLICLEVLAAVGNYAYTIMAQPVGTVRQTFQESAIDDEMIKEMNGIVVENRITEALCNDSTQAKEIAARELRAIRAQRNAVKIVKPAHLADDVGDIVSIPHPYTRAVKRIFVADIERIMVIPKADDESGQWQDSIGGWIP